MLVPFCTILRNVLPIGGGQRAQSVRLPALLALVLLSLSLSIWPVGAQDFPPRPSPARLVNDLAGMLSAEEEARLEAKLVAYDDSTSTQIAVVTVPSIGPYDVADYGQKLAQAWGVGQKGQNNGLLVLVSAQERKTHIATGYGTEERVTDYNSRLILENILKPAFKESRYYDGLDQTTSALMQLLNGTFRAPANYGNRRSQGDGNGVPLILIIVVVVVVLWLISRRGGGGGGGGYRSRGGGFFPPVILGGGGWGGGGGGGGGGGFSGFGGGSFGGGGASGDW